MRPLTLKITLWLIAILIFSHGYGQRTSSHPNLALVGARIYTSPTAAPIEDGTVLIHNGRISAVGPRDKIKVPASWPVIDCKDLTLTAAFWNCHVHFIEPKWQDADLMPAARFNRQMEQMITSHGFVYVYDLAEFSIGNVLRIRNRIKKGDVDGPTIYTTGVPLVPQNGSPFYIAPLKLPEAADPQQAIAHVRQQIDSGADGIKIWTGSPTGNHVVYMSDDIVRQITETAHRFGKPVFAHPTDTRGVIIAMNDGVDILAHTSPDDGRLWSFDTIQQMIAAHLALIPTLKLWKDELKKSGTTDWAHHPLVLTAQQQLHDFYRAGGTVLFGTDVGYLTDYATTDEYILLAGAGLNFNQILAMLTTTPAQRFGQSRHTGRIAVGLDADIVLLAGDPAADIQYLDKVTYTIRQGKIIYNKTPPEATP
ncbi:MAG TPA: amidohydrolase family protein [Puia sp.]|jgi:imidazolonepropionase-like amidohydrolase|nr:amidohydrolase family protein [Puia sp.]